MVGSWSGRVGEWGEGVERGFLLVYLEVYISIYICLYLERGPGAYITDGFGGIGVPRGIQIFQEIFPIRETLSLHPYRGDPAAGRVVHRARSRLGRLRVIRVSDGGTGFGSSGLLGGTRG